MTPTTIKNNPRINGTVKGYYENEKLYFEGTYVHDEKDGPFKHYNENGQLKKEATYKDSKKGPYKYY